MSFLIEVCCDNIKSVINIEESSAERVELCAGLQLGGLTPNYGLVLKALEKSSKKINVLIRPRPGNFVFSDEEFDIMCRDIQCFKSMGINGIVSGILNKKREVDIKRTSELVDLSKPLEFTFHRAFDFCIDLNKAAKDIISCGAERILSSGGMTCVDEGLSNLTNLHVKFGNKIIIMPGGGLNKYNAKLLASAGIKEYHLSATVFESDQNIDNKNCIDGFGYYIKDNQCGYQYSDKNLINDLFDAITLGKGR
ncbi:MAG: copper homeostasis protein CutC [Bacteroidales bacterium]|nr:copper homeostasis protein CutC [Bacteroidales bacterium]